MSTRTIAIAKRLTDGEKAEAFAMLLAGATHEVIASKFGVTTKTIQRLKKPNGAATTPFTPSAARVEATRLELARTAAAATLPVVQSIAQRLEELGNKALDRIALDLDPSCALLRVQCDSAWKVIDRVLSARAEAPDQTPKMITRFETVRKSAPLEISKPIEEAG